MPSSRAWLGIALLSTPLLVLPLHAGCGGGDDSQGAASAGTQKIVGPEGGQLTSDDGKITIDVPAGALATSVTLTVAAAADSTGKAVSVYDLGPNGQQFAKPITLTFQVAGGTSAAAITAATLVAGSWVELSSIARTSTSIRGATTHFSYFGLVPTGIVGQPLADASTDAPYDDVSVPSTDGGSDGGAPDAETPEGSTAGSTVVRTLVYHQITTGTESITDIPAISSDGSRIAFPIAPGTGDAATPNRIYTVNADGSGLLQVDSYKSLCYCESKVAISIDGSTIASTDSTQIRVVTAAGALVGTPLVLNSNEISDIALASNGASVFFIARRDASIVSSGSSGTLANGSPFERGVWTMAADGTGLRQVAGPTAVATLLAKTPADVFPFNTCGPSLGVSANGTRVVFAPGVSGLGDVILGVDGTGTGLHTILGPIGAAQTAGPGVRHTGISSDGSTVLYEVGNTPGVVDPTEIGTIHFDGSGKSKMTSNPPTPVGSCFTPLTLTANGGSLLLGDTGVLFTGSNALSLTLQGGFYSSDPAALVPNGGALSMTMAGSGTHFVYLVRDTAGITQAVTLDIDPANSGAAPTISQPQIAPVTIPRDRSPATLTAMVTATGTSLRVSSAVLLDGLEDSAGSWVSGANVLLDDGMNGDAVSGDGVYTTKGLNAGDGATVGPRVVRVKAEVTAGSARHATAVDLQPFSIE